MKRLLTYLVLGLCTSLAFGQISPGDLSQAHAELEGMSNCTLCHDLGDKVSDQKCLDCHQDIQALRNQRRGYHNDRRVRAQNCFDCHSEHHGRKFDMVRFDQDNFDHQRTGYALEGQHEIIDCRKCHAPEYIADPEIRTRTNTFLGLDQQCLSCHEDYHQGTLAEDCASCHNIEAFRPAPRFDHALTDYPLLGEHEAVDCRECHETTTLRGKEFQVFSGIKAGDCAVCHNDPHNDRISGKCSQCHTETGFARFVGQKRFNHNRTLFTLKGKHSTVNCFACHAQTHDPGRVFADQSGVGEQQCAVCHEDQHDGKFGSDCAQCHQESSFLSLKSMDFFDHDVTDYPLTGQHVAVDCKQCHPQRFSTPINFTACNHCHEDYHQGEFKVEGQDPDCVECHSLDQGFDFSLYTLQQHQQTAFPLLGAHLATPCFACHLDESQDRWRFRDIGSECVQCHEDLHEGYISTRFYQPNSCASCHNNDSWSVKDFDHKRTNWPLEGAHIRVDCRDCHFQMEDNRLVGQQFARMETQCVSCHENVHDDEFAINGVTDCTRCHITESWFPEKFDHNTTAFPLDGKHAEAECRACHEIEADDGSIVVVYQIPSFECIDCHQ